MKKSDTNSQKSAGKKVEAPVQLTPEQLEIVAAGFRAAINRGTLGDIIKDITIFGRFPTPTMPVPLVSIRLIMPPATASS